MGEAVPRPPHHNYGGFVIAAGIRWYSVVVIRLRCESKEV